MTIMADTTQTADSFQSQILIKLGAMGEDIAVIKDRMTALQDHEQRIRELRSDVPANLTGRLVAMELASAQSQGSRDVVSRVWASAAALAAVGSAVVAYLHK